MTDKQLVATVRAFRSGILGPKGQSKDQCLAVCAPLQSFLQSAFGFETELVEGELAEGRFICNHFWLKLPDGRILDPTADQFVNHCTMPDVYLGVLPSWYKPAPIKEHHENPATA